MKWVPFTVHIKISPNKAGKRFENWRDMQKLSNYIYNALETLVPDTINIATPGGGQKMSNGGFSSHVNGTAVKPQFGESPAQLQITGFYKTESANSQVYSDLKTIHTNEILSGSNEHSNEVMPINNINNEANALKLAMEAAINANIPIAINYKIFRLDYSGVMYGDRGYHFTL